MSDDTSLASGAVALPSDEGGGGAAVAAAGAGFRSMCGVRVASRTRTELPNPMRKGAHAARRRQPVGTRRVPRLSPPTGRVVAPREQWPPAAGPRTAPAARRGRGRALRHRLARRPRAGGGIDIL